MRASTLFGTGSTVSSDGSASADVVKSTTRANAPSFTIRTRAQRPLQVPAQPQQETLEPLADPGDGMQSDVESAHFLAEAYHHLQHELAKVIVS